MTDFRRLFKEYNILWCEANEIYESYASSKGLSYTAFLVVLSLTEGEGPVTQNDISRLWQLPKQTVNSILDSFSRKGYVTLVRSNRDGRAKEIVLTEEGRTALVPVMEEIRNLEARAGERLGEERLRELITLSQELNKLLSAELEALK